MFHPIEPLIVCRKALGAAKMAEMPLFFRFYPHVGKRKSASDTVVPVRWRGLACVVGDNEFQEEIIGNKP